MLLLVSLQAMFIEALRSGLKNKHVINTLEADILQHPELHRLVQQRARERRGLPTAPHFNPDHIPGVLRKHDIRRDGKQRTVFSPEDPDYCQAQYYQIGIIGPVADATVDTNTYAYRQGLGINDAVIKALDITMSSSDCVWDQQDIKDCFNTVPTRLAEAAYPQRSRNYIEQLRHRYRELTLATGLPQGHPASASVINTVINTLLTPTRQAYEGVAIIIVYSDDITAIGTRTAVKQVRKDINAALAAHGMRLNPTKSRTARPVQGQTLTLLGYDIEWQTPQATPLIRPRRNAYSRLQEALATAIDLNHIQAICRGWQNAYRLTNDARHLTRMQHAIENGTNRWRDSNHRIPGPDHGGKS